MKKDYLLSSLNPQTYFATWVSYSIDTCIMALPVMKFQDQEYRIREMIQNLRYFFLKINIPKENYWILRIGVMGTFDFQSQFSYRHLSKISCDQSSKSYMKDTYLVNFFPCIISSTMSIKYNGMIHQVENDFRSQYIG